MTLATSGEAPAARSASSHVERELVTGYRLVELIGDATADKRGSDADTSAQTTLHAFLNGGQ